MKTKNFDDNETGCIPHVTGAWTQSCPFWHQVQEAISINLQRFLCFTGQMNVIATFIGVNSVDLAAGYAIQRMKDWLIRHGCCDGGNFALWDVLSHPPSLLKSWSTRESIFSPCELILCICRCRFRHWAPPTLPPAKTVCSSNQYTKCWCDGELSSLSTWPCGQLQSHLCLREFGHFKCKFCSCQRWMRFSLPFSSR